MKLRTTMLTSAFATALAVASCSDDSSKKIAPGMEAGAAGEAGEPSSGGGTAGVAGNGAGGMVDLAGAGGATGGASDSAGAAGELGAAGAAPTPLSPLFLFTVEAGAVGVPSSGVATSVNPQSTLFASSTLNPDPVRGRNVAQISAAQLGLADTDTIDAFAVMQPTPGHAVYWFSVGENAQGPAGERPTRLSRSAQDAEAVGDVYFSDGAISFRSFGEGGDRLGYNGLVTDEQSIGLSPIAGTEGHIDNLTGVQLLTDGQLPSTLYFSVGAGSAGLRGTAVAATALADRACTIFKSALDGQNTVAFSCAELGLGTASDVRGLVVYGTTAPSEVLFTVDRASTGLPGSGVESAATLPSDVFASALDGSNTLQVAGFALGLNPTDQLDALTVVDQPVASYAFSTTCNLNPAPSDAQGAAIAAIRSAHQLGRDLILVEGSDLVATGSDGVGAYRLKTCQFVARSAVAPGALQGRTWAAVPLAGWSAATPFAALEYWTLANDGTSVNRLDVSGALLESFTFPDVPGNTYTSFGLDYDPVHDRFYAVLAPHVGPGDYQRLSFPRPPAGASSGAPLDSLTTPIPHPCAYAPAHSGVDALGNSVYAQFDSSTNTDFRVCALSARSGEFTGLPFTWSVRAQRPNFSVLIPDDALYGLIVSDAVSVERYARKL